jgi:hypothetical protein
LFTSWLRKAYQTTSMHIHDIITQLS